MCPSSESIQSTPDTQPIPPRYWWLKRFTIAGLVTIAACIGLRLWWGFEADRRLQALIDEYRAAGQPVLIEDFADILSVPDDQNAALPLLEAAQKLVYPENTGLPYPSELLTLSAVAEHPKEVRQILELNSDVLRLASEARSRPRANWKKGLGSGQVSNFSAQRVICQLLTVSALHAHLTGNHAESLESIHDLLLQADAVLRHPLLIDQLVGYAIESLALNLIEEVGGHLRFDESAAEPRVLPASRGQAAEIIAYLLDFDQRHQQSILAAFGERATALEELNKLRIAGPVGIDVVLAPAAVLETTLAMQARTLAIEALQTGNALAAQRVFNSWGDHQPVYLPTAIRPFYGGLSYTETDRSANNLYFKLEASRRMAAIALAMRLYESDHQSRPTSLDRLVPTYLPRLPDDPFAPAGTTFRRMHTLDSEVLYSVGPDGNDDGGVPLRGSKSEIIPPYERAGDIPFYLDGRPETRSSPPQASTQTGKDDIDSGEQGGDAEQNDAPGDRPK